ncbi:MAG: hypothetical protein L0Y73_02760 [Candidatus Aminicenantes bacterium]|nr:hypothetical protein [Candidatus Aminicenantes bacterium]
MSTNKNSQWIIGLALLVMGIISLLGSFNVSIPFHKFWIPVILIIVGVLVILLIKRGFSFILGCICLVYGVLLLLMTLNLFNIAFLWKILPIYWILFGLILLF